MLSWMSLLRLLRRRFVLGLIFALSLTYCALSLFQHERKSILLGRDREDDESWQMQVSKDETNVERIVLTGANGSLTIVDTCRNSVQGKVLIVDERGLVCARKEVLPSGCCSTEHKPAGTEKSEGGVFSVQTARERYSCETCSSQGCCAVYEYCVSCCLNPGKTDGSEGDPVQSKNHRPWKVEEAGQPNPNANTIRLRLRTLDPFQICLATCRTSSASVRHENTYKDPDSKHCYNLQSPNLNFLHQRHQRDLIGRSNNDDDNNNNDNPAVVVTPSSAVSFLSFFLVSFPQSTR